MARAHTPQPAAQQAGAPSAGAPALERRIGISGALVIGLASMVGAGLFAAFAPAAEAAGGALLVGLAIALVAASCNALAPAQLAAQYPSSGGSYLYGRECLGEWAGCTAGWGFVIGKTASTAAMALTAAAYLAPAGWMKPAAIVAIVLLVGANLLGITRTALAMSRNKDLPGVFGHINTRSSVPDYSLLLVGLAAIVLIVLGDIRTVIGFSSVGVLAYYLIANLAALSQDDTHRFVPKWLQWIGAALCTILIVTLPWQSIAAGVFVLAVGLLGRVMVLQHR
ncbi:APC family permease [Pseudoclavibacter albus]|uniref:amino acid permease n=1 Tax=Pseudoclavibacter albus TaxID=272241 RepID=UPI000826CFD0|nr:amino acid permease [Pseudoclavibacter alba]